MLDAYHWNWIWFFFVFGSILIFLPIIFMYSLLPKMGYNVLGVAPVLFKTIHLDLVQVIIPTFSFLGVFF